MIGAGTYGRLPDFYVWGRMRFPPLRLRAGVPTKNKPSNGLVADATLACDLRRARRPRWPRPGRLLELPPRLVVDLAASVADSTGSIPCRHSLVDGHTRLAQRLRCSHHVGCELGLALRLADLVSSGSR